MISEQKLNQGLSSRIDYIDIFKSLGIIIMIMGHIGYGKTFDYFIHAFHMPIFFWASGFLFKHRTKEEMPFNTFLLKKIKTFVVPYFVFGIAHYLFYVGMKVVSGEEFSIKPLLHLLWINSDGLAICGALWFISALFFVEIIFFLIERYAPNGILKAVIVLMFVTAGHLASIYLPKPLPYSLGICFVSIGLYYVGYLFRKYEAQKVITFVMNLKWIPNIILAIITTFLIFKNGYVNMRIELYANIPMFWLNALLSVIVGINFSKLIYKIIHKNVVGRFLLDIGKNSIVYVLLNEITVVSINKIFGFLGVPVYVSCVVNLFITLGFLMIVSKIFIKTKLKVLIGKI